MNFTSLVPHNFQEGTCTNCGCSITDAEQWCSTQTIPPVDCTEVARESHRNFREYLQTNEERINNRQHAIEVTGKFARLFHGNPLKGKSHYYDDPDGPDCLTASAAQNNHDVRCTAYHPRLRQFLGSRMSITNYANFLSHPKWPHRFWLVLDEGHNIESQILNFAGNVLTPRECESKYGLTLPIFKRPDETRAWLQAEYLRALAKRLDEIKSQLQEYKDAGDIPASAEDRVKKLAKEQDAISRRQTALNVMLQGDSKDWFLASDWKWDKNKGSGNLIIKPLNCRSYASRLFNRADKILIMSGTILSPEVFMGTLGIDPARTEFHAWNSSFPVANRPIHYRPVGSMTYPCRQCRSNSCCRKQTLPRMVQRVAEIVASYPNVKGIVHTQSYEVNQCLVEGLIAAGFGSRVIAHKNSEERAEAEELHRSGTEPTVLLSPGMTEGLDLVDDLSRFQIITKVPYPNWGDPYIKARKNHSPEWYDWVTAVTLIQASGRSVRSMTDHADTFILDSCFDGFLSRQEVKRLFPGWWIAALQGWQVSAFRPAGGFRFKISAGVGRSKRPTGVKRACVFFDRDMISGRSSTHTL